ncbi:DUF2789 family protein [Colwellia sp. BRX10-6]|nr:DUF2789 family protein [Colwellia sp. BRX10-9]MBA6394122.1 DUF2789 family protein [Colwellia sp. BRX10-6]
MQRYSIVSFFLLYLNFSVLCSIQAILNILFLIRNVAIINLSNHTISCLFSQLGMNNVQADITSFIETHKAIPVRLPLY